MKKAIKILIIVGIIILYVNNWEQCISLTWGLSFLAFIGFLISKVIRCLIVDPINKRKNKKRKEEQQRLKIIENEEKKISLLKSFNAPITQIYNYGHCKYILISEIEKKVMLEETVYDFKQILNCVSMDDSETVSLTTKHEKSNTGNVIVRTIVGKFFLGNAGAIVGGLTSDRTSTISEETIKERHNYTVKIGINSLTKPIIRIPLGENGVLTDEIHSLFNVIISRKYI